MRVVHERCCGLDVHKKMVVACVLTPEGQQIRTFGTMTRDLVGLSQWLHSLDVSQVAMESTGVFWQPIVRHEALFDREGMKGPSCGPSQRSAEAEGSLILETQGRVGSSPDNDGASRHYQTARVRQARREGVRE